MNFGFSAPSRGPLATPDALATLAQRGEALGYGIISVSDHIVMPRRIDSIYPYNESGRYTGGSEALELLTAITYLAAVTSKIRLLTSVMVVPHRSPVLTAKILSTIDVLSKGRLTVGCGAGWLREEFNALNVPPFEHRGSITNEYIQAFKSLWCDEAPTFQGRYCNFSDIYFEPKPVQKPHPPIWIGGESPAALRRVARFGDALYPIGSNPTYPVTTPEQMKESLRAISQYATEAGRDPMEIDLAYNVNWNNDTDAIILSNGTRRSFTGTPSQIAEDIHTFETLGVRHLVLSFQQPNIDATLGAMERFALNIIPLTH